MQNQQNTLSEWNQHYSYCIRPREKQDYEEEILSIKKRLIYLRQHADSEVLYDFCRAKRALCTKANN